MEDYTINKTLDLFIKNSEMIKEVKGSWQMGMMQ